MPFTEDYYERGVECCLSCYENYRWLPELTIPMCERLIEHLGIEKHECILDFGCAKGYMVRAFRMLGYRAAGVDISPYAIAQADAETRQYLYLAGDKFAKLDADWTICKDVLEHLDEVECLAALRHIRGHSKKLFVAVPLGNNGVYTIPEMEKDITHKIRRPAWWWSAICEEAGWKVSSNTFSMRGVKENWTRAHPFGNSFIICQ